MMITVKLRCDYIQELSGGVRDADGCGAGREEEGGGRQKREKAQCFHYAVTSAVRREAPPGRAGRGGEGSRGGGVIKSVHS